MINQVWINESKKKFIVSDMPIIPVGFDLLKEFDSWQSAVKYAHDVNEKLDFEIDYDNDFTRSNFDEDFEMDD